MICLYSLRYKHTKQHVFDIFWMFFLWYKWIWYYINYGLLNCHGQRQLKQRTLLPLRQFSGIILHTTGIYSHSTFHNLCCFIPRNVKKCKNKINNNNENVHFRYGLSIFIFFDVFELILFSVGNNAWVYCRFPQLLKG